MRVILSQREYEDVLRVALKGHGLTAEQAAALIAARWPLIGPGLLHEASGRGLFLELADLEDWIEARFGRRVDPAELGFDAKYVDEFLGWALSENRGRPSPAGLVAAARPTFADEICRVDRAPWN
jgi:hypothetical protein